MRAFVAKDLFRHRVIASLDGAPTHRGRATDAFEHGFDVAFGRHSRYPATR